MPVKKKDTDRAIALLEDYCKTLKKPEEQQLKKAIKKVMGIFKSSLFQALLGYVNADVYLPESNRFVVVSIRDSARWFLRKTEHSGISQNVLRLE